VAVVAAVALLAVAAGRADAEPRFAVREGMQCSQCHVNRTGGGMRTPFGISFAQTNLGTFRQRGLFDPHLGGSVTIGGNLRLSNRTLLPTRTELDGVARKRRASNSFESSESNLYLLADTIPGRLAVYVDETVGPEAAFNREAFVLVQGLPVDGYIKAGHFMLPFGLRIPDDNAFIRAATGFNYANSDLGIEMGIEHGPFALKLAVSNGSLGSSDTNRSKQITVHATAVSQYVRGGLSFAWNNNSSPDFKFQSITSGAHMGGRLGRLTLLGELDWIHAITDPEPYDQTAVYFESNFEAHKGVYARFRFEAFDPLVSLANNERDRFVAGVSWFPIQLFEISAYYRLNRDITQRIESNADEIVVEAHAFL